MGTRVVPALPGYMSRASTSERGTVTAPRLGQAGELSRSWHTGALRET